MMINDNQWYFVKLVCGASDTSDTSNTSNTSDTSGISNTHRKRNTCIIRNTRNKCSTRNTGKTSNALAASDANNTRNTRNNKKWKHLWIDYRVICIDRIVYVDSIGVRQVDNLQELSVSTEVLSEPHKMPQVFERMYITTIIYCSVIPLLTRM